MNAVYLTLLLILAAAASVVVFAAWQARRRNLQRWLGSYIRQSIERRLAGPPRNADEPIHILLCIADHFEPSWNGDSGVEATAIAETADARVQAWVREYPRLLGAFRDTDGRAPRHTFFYPIDQYEPRHVDAIATLCQQGFGEVEIHLHHDNDTAENLERTLNRFQHLFVQRHGLLGHWPDGRIAYGFVHGNWALDNSRPDGRWCGVHNELDVLRRTGCYADFTLPAAPDASQTSKINSIYYAIGSPGCCRSHDRGVDVGMAPPPSNGLMLVQGPLRLWWPKGSWTPRIENGCLQHTQPPSMARLEQWIRAGVSIPSRPDWLFVKLHTHGAPESNQRLLLGEPMLKFHRELAERAAQDTRFKFHYVTAREMYNLAKAAEAGWTGTVAAARDFCVAPARPNNAKIAAARAA